MNFLDEPYIRYREEQARRDAEELKQQKREKGAQGAIVRRLIAIAIALFLIGLLASQCGIVDNGNHCDRGIVWDDCAYQTRAAGEN